MTVTVPTLENIQIDGADSGRFVDAFDPANKESFWQPLCDFRDAIHTSTAAELQKKDADCATTVASQASQAASILAGVEAELATATASLADLNSTHQALLDSILNSTTLEEIQAIPLIKAANLASDDAAKAARVAELQAELASLTTSS